MTLTKFSEIVSRVFFLGWLVLLIIAALFKTGQHKLSFIILIPVFLIILASYKFFFDLLRKKGKISDWHITKREERHLFFAIQSGISLFAAVFSYFATNSEFFVLSLTIFILALSISLLTFIFKISGHMALNVGVIFLLNFLFDWKLLWLFLIVPVVAFARLYLKKHTLFQILAGSFVGLIIPYFVLKFFKLI